MAGVRPFRVDFVIGGTQKGGTSALAHFLRAHPEICMPKHKEVHFFDAPDFSEEADDTALARRYRKAFPKELTGRVVGDATPVYAYLPWVAGRVRRYNPGMKWILLLRDPVERAISHYAMERARGAEFLPLPLALRLERLRLWQDRHRAAWKTSLRHHSYLDRGRYSRQIARLWEHFPKEQVLVVESSVLRGRHEETLRTVYRFLGVREDVEVPPPETVFPTGKTVMVSDRTRAWMRARMAGEIDRLESMLGWKLDAWRG